MSARQQERYYWLKLPNDFFDNHTLRILRGMDGGQYALLLYIELLAESVTREGRLRCSEKVAYDEAMIASMFGFSEEQVKHSFSLLKKFELMVIEEDGTLVFPELGDMVGNETRKAAEMRVLRASCGKEKENTDRTNGEQGENKGRTDGEHCGLENRDKRIEIRDKNIKSESIPAHAQENDSFGHQCNVTERHEPTWEEFVVVLKQQQQISANPIEEWFAKQWFDSARMSMWRDAKGQDMRIPYVWRRKLQYEWNDELKRQRSENGGRTNLELKHDRDWEEARRAEDAKSDFIESEDD